MQILFFILFAALIVVMAVLSHQAAKKRREAMQTLAARLGLTFDPSKHYNLDEQFAFLNKLRQGSNRYGFNLLRGAMRGHQVMAFDYHYETHSTDSKGRRQTHHHYFSFFLLWLPKTFPELTIGPEGLFSKLGQMLGFDDIDFESHEFSRRFCVRSKDKKFAYDFCHGQTIEYLLANPDLAVEVDRDILAVGFNRRLRPDQIEVNLGRLIQLRDLMPAYLFESGAG